MGPGVRWRRRDGPGGPPPTNPRFVTIRKSSRSTLRRVGDRGPFIWDVKLSSIFVRTSKSEMSQMPKHRSSRRAPSPRRRYPQTVVSMSLRRRLSVPASSTHPATRSVGHTPICSGATGPTSRSSKSNSGILRSRRRSDTSLSIPLRRPGPSTSSGSEIGLGLNFFRSMSGPLNGGGGGALAGPWTWPLFHSESAAGEAPRLFFSASTCSRNGSPDSNFPDPPRCLPTYPRPARHLPIACPSPTRGLPITHPNGRQPA